MTKENYEFPEKMLEMMDAETIERHHKYMILFDDGQLADYIGDEHRRRFVDEALKENKCGKQ